MCIDELDDWRKSIPERADYKPDAWKQYSLDELGQWVHLLAKRAQHRSDARKRTKDFNDAQIYLNMMQTTLDELRNSKDAVVGGQR